MSSAAAQGGAREPVVLYACGSFNPITNLHLRIFELARDELNESGRFEVVGGFVSPVHNNYGKPGLLPSPVRIDMAKLAVASSPWIRVDTWEAEQADWIPTAQVLGEISKRLARKELGDLHATKTPRVMLLCGADLVESFATPGVWKREDVECIVRDYGLACIKRAGSDVEKFIYGDDFLHAHRQNIVLATEWMTNDISSTKIRRAIRRGQSIRYVVPDPVVEYIAKHNLYKD